jgi:tetratricopeptide (TPR) repeat protein
LIGEVLSPDEHNQELWSDRTAMSELDGLLGFDRNASVLVEKFLSGARRLTIKGPSGSGKTTLGKSVSDKIAESDCTAIWLRGDPGRTEQQFYPLTPALKPHIFGRILGVGTKIFEGIAEDFLPTGKGTAKALLSLLPSGDAQREPVKDATDISQEFLSLVGRSIKRHRLLIIADDIQYFDPRTLKLLRRLLEDKSARAESGLVSILSIINTSTSVRNDIALIVGSLTATANAVELRYCAKEAFGQVLLALGLNIEIPKSLSDLLYDCSGGHLHIANFIVDELKTLALPDIPPAAYSDLLHYIIQRRLEDAPNFVTLLLRSAAHIGRIFSREELACLTELDAIRLQECLNTVIALRFVEGGGHSFTFSHEIIRTYFVKDSSTDQIGYSVKYSECLRILRPHDYFARCLSLTTAQDSASAAVAYCQGIIAEWRSGRRDPSVVEADLRRLVRLSDDERSFLTAICDSYDLLLRGDFRQAQLRLADSPIGLSEILTAERDYILAEALLKDLGTSKSDEARSILCEWDLLKKQEPELWCRMRLLLLLAYVQLCRFDEARKTEREIISFLSARSSFDKGAEKQINRLLALSEMHSVSEIARKRIVQACNYYESQLIKSGYADLYEYFICLTNRSGNAITTRNYADAIEQGLKALSLIRDYESLRLPARWAAANNVVIASHLDRRLSAIEAVTFLDELATRFPNLDDDLLIYSNIGSMKLLGGDIDASLAAFAHTEERLRLTPDMDPFYRYLVESNRAIASHLNGEESAKRNWEMTEQLISGIGPAMRADLRERHDAVSPLFNSETIGNRGRWTSAFAKMMKTNTRYKGDRFPEGVFLTDIQIWSSL